MIRRRLSSRALLVLTSATAAATLGLSACSTGTEGARDAGSSRSPAASTPAVGSKVAGADLGRRLSSAVAEKKTAQVRLTQSGARTSAGTGAIRQDGERSSISLELSQGDKKVAMRLLPGVLYVDSGQPIEGKRWLKLAEGGTDPVSRLLAPLFATVRQSADISSQAELFGKAGQFTVAGSEEVGGVRATHYEGVLPRAALVEQLPEQMRKVVGAQITADAPIELWVDDSGLPLRVRQTSTVGGSTTTSTVEYAAWGEPVTIEAPAAADTTTPPANLGG